MKIVITGSESFVGQELIKECQKQKIDVLGLDLKKTSDLDYEFIIGDIRSENLPDLIPEGVDAVVHLAALSRDPDCKNRAHECFDINVMGTLNVARAAMAKNVKQLIFASTEWVYGDFKGGEIKDECTLIDITTLNSEYALSKLVSESNLRQQYQYGLCSTTILRFGIIYGPRLNNWSAVESLMDTIKNKDEIVVGSLQTGRCFIHVSDIAKGIIKSIGLPGFNIIGLEGDKLVALGDIINAGQLIFHKTIQITESNPNQISIRNVSNRKAKQVLGWQPEIDLEEGLKSLIAL
ncbi:MAG: NAD(P)-dependent oxidoreductase [Patescibacteria group bacterium]